MPSKDTDRVLKAIAYNIDLARRFIDGLSFESFAGDERTVYAVTRCLEIISEASRRLPADLKARYPDVPWSRMAAAGNIYRHDYEDVLATILWTTVKDYLGELERAVRAEGA
jgi:uncharacterized protein with HEPN domain